MNEYENEKLLFWIGSSLSDLKDCPDEVQDFVGYALHWAQRGGKSRKGIATPKQDIDLVKARLKRAETHYAAWIAETQGKKP